MANTLNIPYREIVSNFETAVNEHLGVATFGTGTIDFLDANAVDKAYPYIFLRPMSTIQSNNERILSFELYSLDVPKLSDESPIDVMSNTEEYLYDIMAWFNKGPLQQTYEVVMTNCIPVNEAFQDRVYGWAANVDVITPFVMNYCDYPKL